jgi:cysteine desulfurase family protein (TIGR01976 family)
MALLENAGGSQVPRCVADAIRAYMLESYVQLGAGYAMSDVATATVERAHTLVTTILNGMGTGTVILGPSFTQLCYLIASRLAARIKPGDEIVLSEAGHEANIGPWLQLERQGAVIRWWRVDRTAMDCTFAGLDEVLSPRTQLVAFPHVSNLLGNIADVAEITRRAHAVGARVFVDGVAYAPHRAMDVAAWDVDWYGYSTYKVYGPHMGALYGRHDALAELEGPNHFFIPKEQLPYKFQLGGVSHEGCAGLCALQEYLACLAGPDAPQAPAPSVRGLVERAFMRMTQLELPLQEQLVSGLARLPGIRILGTSRTTAHDRVPTVSVLHHRFSPVQVVRHVQSKGVAIRNGHMYAYRLCQALGVDTTQGVVRVSAVHYNSPAEIERLLSAVAEL